MDKKIRRNRIRRARKVRRMKKMLTSGVLLLAALLFLSLVFVPKVSAERELKARSAREAVSWRHTRRKKTLPIFFRM